MLFLQIFEFEFLQIIVNRFGRSDIRLYKIVADGLRQYIVNGPIVLQYFVMFSEFQIVMIDGMAILVHVVLPLEAST